MKRLLIAALSLKSFDAFLMEQIKSNGTLELDRRGNNKIKMPWGAILMSYPRSIIVGTPNKFGSHWLPYSNEHYLSALKPPSPKKPSIFQKLRSAFKDNL